MELQNRCNNMWRLYNGGEKIMTIRDVAYKFYDYGFNVLPCIIEGDKKRPYLPSDSGDPYLWKHLQNARLTKDRLTFFFDNIEKEGKQLLIGVIPGKITDGKYKDYNFFAIDFDDSDNIKLLDITLEKCKKVGVYFEKTNRGYHLYGITQIKKPSCKDSHVKMEYFGTSGFIVVYDNFEHDFYNLIPMDVQDVYEGWVEILEEKKNIKKPKRKISDLKKGVKYGERNISSFKLACQYRDADLSKEEATKLLFDWNRKNHPPLHDREIISCIKSAFSKESKKKKSKIKEIFVSNYNLENGIYLEEIIQDGIECFLAYDIENDTWDVINDYPIDEKTIIKPYPIENAQRDAVIVPDGVEEYNSLEELRIEMLDFALAEYDPVDNKDLYELTINLMLTSWISPVWQQNMAERFIPIINPRGPSETGKKRYLTVARWLTYHSLYGLKTNRVPTLFRAIAPLDGTLILDEADMNDSSLSSELVEFLNSRCDGVPIPRFSVDSKKVDWWRSFGMTVLATREGFTDDGLESRCTVMPTATTDNPGNYNLIPPRDWLEKGKQLQRKLLLFKLRHIKGEMPTQLIIPNVTSFRVRESLLIIQGLKNEDSKLFNNISKLALVLQERIIKERAASPEGLLLNLIHNHLTDEKTHLEKEGLGYIIVKESTNKKDNPDDEEPETNYYPITLRSLNKSLGEAFSSSKLAKMWRGMNQDTISQKKLNNRRHRGVILIKNLKRLDRIFPKYICEYDTPSCMKIELESVRQSELEVVENEVP